MLTLPLQGTVTLCLGLAELAGEVGRGGGGDGVTLAVGAFVVSVGSLGELVDEVVGAHLLDGGGAGELAGGFFGDIVIVCRPGFWVLGGGGGVGLGGSLSAVV